MPRLARGEVLDPSEVQVVHCVQRCVRRAFLCGRDDLTGQDYEHRRGWIRQRLEFLAGVFSVDCLTYTVLSNHVHLVLRSRPDVVATWSDEEVARRWLTVFPKRRERDGSPAEPSAAELAMITGDPEVLAERRRRLSDLSWWMRCTAENIARRSNAEDEVTGHFWEGRFKAQVLLDEASVLACAAYVDLNPIRAALAETPETSRYTGAKDRIDDLAERADRSRPSTHDWERSRRRSRSGSVSPIEVDERNDAAGTSESHFLPTPGGLLRPWPVEKSVAAEIGPIAGQARHPTATHAGPALRALKKLGGAYSSTHTSNIPGNLGQNGKFFGGWRAQSALFST